MTDDYATLAADYHWLRSGESVLAVLARNAEGLLAGGADLTVLDCACGIGTDAIALAANGYSVWASDGSAAMVVEAQRRVAAAGLSVPVIVCRWEDLPACYSQRFHVLLCLGNSISHVGRPAMAAAFAGMVGVLRDGGRLIVNARNWEKLRHDRPRVSVRGRFEQSEGQRCLPIYLWTWASDWDAPHRVEILFVVEGAGAVTVKRHELTFWPFGLPDVHHALAEAGLRVVGDNYDPDADWYEVVAERVPATPPAPA